MKPVYLHPLDYGIGAKYYLTREEISIEYRIDSNSFYVEELIDLDSLGYSTLNGNYVVLGIYKKNVETFEILNTLARKLGIPRENILYMGLKDKNSTSLQYFFIRKELVDPYYLGEGLVGKSYRIVFKGYVRRKPRRRDVIGNKFKVFVKDTEYENYVKAKKILEQINKHGLPSYYGYQRFGVKRTNTHILGKYLVLNRLDLFIEELLHNIYPGETIYSIRNRVRNNYTGKMLYEKIIYNSKDLEKSIKKVLSLINNLYIDAYSSYLYNLLLNKIIDSMGWNMLDQEYPSIGCSSSLNYYRDICSIEGIKIENNNLFRCWFRRGLFKPLSIDIVFKGNSMEISFVLKSGFYASIVLRELFKEKLVL